MNSENKKLMHKEVNADKVVEHLNWWSTTMAQIFDERKEKEEASR